MAVECVSVESKSLDRVQMEFVVDDKKVEFVIRVGVDTVKEVLGEIVQNYTRLFSESPSAAAVEEWAENLRTFFPKKVGRFLVYKTVMQKKKRVT